jgi:hypothetical protein
MPENKTTFTPGDLKMAIAELSLIPYFPKDEDGRVMVMNHLRLMCPSLEALRYTTRTAVTHMRKWSGVPELRGILCNRYNAADGEDTWSAIPGLRGIDNEARAIADHRQRLLAEAKPMADESAALIRQLTGGEK